MRAAQGERYKKLGVMVVLDIELLSILFMINKAHAVELLQYQSVNWANLRFCNYSSVCHNSLDDFRTASDIKGIL